MKKESNDSFTLILCPGCGRKQPPFLFDEGAELCMGCVDKGAAFTDRVAKPKLTYRKKDNIIDSVKKRGRPRKVVEVGEVDQQRAIQKQMERYLNDEATDGA